MMKEESTSTERKVRVRPREAIRMFCYECMGLEGNLAEIGRCTVQNCAFFAFRPMVKNKGLMPERLLKATKGYDCLTQGQKARILARKCAQESIQQGNPGQRKVVSANNAASAGKGNKTPIKGDTKPKE